jgi:hypothetical protein
MTGEEYKAFWHRAAMAFPSIAKLFTVVDFHSNRTLSDADREERHHLWKQTFYPLDNEDCNNALAEMVAGRIPGPTFDCSDFPGKIRAQASEYRNRRAKELANAGLQKSLRGDGKKIRCEIDAEVKEIERRAKALFISRRPDIEWPWKYLDVCNFDRRQRWELWQECVREVCEEIEQERAA